MNTEILSLVLLKKRQDYRELPVFSCLPGFLVKEHPELGVTAQSFRGTNLSGPNESCNLKMKLLIACRTADPHEMYSLVCVLSKSVETGKNQTVQSK